MISGDHDLVKGKFGPFYYLLEEFSKYWDRVDVICDSGGENLKQKYFNNVYLHGGTKKTSDLVQIAKKLYQTVKFDFITVPGYPPFRHARAAAKLNQELGVPYTIEVHHVVGYPKAADLKELLFKLYFQFAFKNISQRAKAIRVVNQKQVPEFLFKCGIDNNRLIYLSSFYLDLKTFYPQNLEKKYDFVFVGRLAKNKGLKLFLKILIKYQQEQPNFKAAIIGLGPKEVWLKSMIEKNGLVNNVQFLGWLKDNQALAEVYNQAKILLITSTNEGGPRVAVEAMACGTPVISTPVGAMIDLIKGGQNGYLVDWSCDDFLEKIKIILNNYSNFNPQKISATVRDFDYQETIKKYAEKLRGFLNPHP